VRATAAEETQSGGLVLLCLASWAIPGAGHLWLGRRGKGLIFLITLPLMFSVGYGAGVVRAVTYEYGNAFLIVAGLLNLLVMIDAYDVAMGRK
jgi:hypothetical protein